LLGRDALVEVCIAHGAISVETGDRAVDRPDELGVPPGLGRKLLALLAQRIYLVESRRIEDRGDLRKRDVEFPVKQDLLQTQQLLATIVPVAVPAHMRGLQKAD